MITGDLTDLALSEAIVIQKLIRTQGQFLDDHVLTAEDFSSNLGAWAFDTIRKMVGASAPIDHMTVGLADKRIETYVWEHSDATLSNADYHADLIHEAGIRRRLIAVGEAIPQMARSQGDLASLIDTVRKHVDDAAGMKRSSVQFVGDDVDKVIADIGKPRRRFETPWRALNETLGGGLRPGGLYILAARPGIGKSALALMMASRLTQHGFVAFSSLEMGREEIMLRLIAQESGVPLQVLERSTPLSDYQAAQVAQWRERAPVSLAIDDSSGSTVSDIKAHARTVSRNGQLAGVVVDYLQLMTGDPNVGRVEQVSAMSRQLKLMARDLDVPVIALSQLNRKSEDRADKRPMVSDLRESGSIEQDADVVMLLHRDPNAAPEADPLGVITTAPLEVIVGKNRQGPTLTHQLYWDGAFVRADE